MTRPEQQSTWFLEGFTDGTRRIWRTPLSVPFRIGRSRECQLSLDSPAISHIHAEVVRQHDQLRLLDLGSTNGTFVNDRRVERDHALHDGDLIRFADWEFRITEHIGTFSALTATRELQALALMRLAEETLEEKFREMVRDRAIRALFQPIVRLADGEVMGYEALGRGIIDGTEVQPSRLFAIAEEFGRAAELSDLLRREQLSAASELPMADPELFLNTHPAELETADTLGRSLTDWRGRGAKPRLCIEINETAAMEVSLLAGLRENLAAMDVHVAFDDFGMGQPRLLELAEISPRYVKFDRAWVHDLDRASTRRSDLVRTLVGMVRELEITPIAEGVERGEEAEVCAELGFELAQGFYLGRPDQASAF